MADETADAAQSRKTGIRAGLGVIAFGLVTAILLYIVESRSTRAMRPENAAEFAIMYVLFCAVVGLMVFRWFNRHAPDYTTAPEPGQTAPTKEQTWTRRRATLGGLLAIALGFASAIVMYLTDMASFDFLTKMHAMEFAILHAFLWSIAGGVLILCFHWLNRRPPDHSGRALFGWLVSILKYVPTRGKPKGTTTVVKRDQ
jgi:H+/Cl- antiporter ClcA